MTNLLIVIGSARKGRVADKVTTYVQEEIAKRDNITATVADLVEVNLPFFDNELSPTHPDFKETNEIVTAWTKQVADADAVLFVTPEYNHALSAIQKNAIDWIGAEWENKPVTAAAYGFYAGQNSINALRELAPVVKMDLKENPAQLGLMQDLNPDGTLLDEAAVREKIAAALDEIAVPAKTAIAVS